MVKGEIYFANSSPRSGSELRGSRPCILVSHNQYTAAPRWTSVTVVPCSTSERWLAASPTRVQFEVGECGFTKRCAAIPAQITTLDKSKLRGGPIGRLSLEKEAALAEALRNYLGID